MNELVPQREGGTTSAVIAAAVALALVALAVAGGGFGPVPLGVATFVLWLALGALALAPASPIDGLTPAVVAGALLLVLIAAWSALSLRWGTDDGAAFAELVRLLLYLGVFLVAGLAARRGSARSWLAGLALGGLVVALLALGSRVLGFGADQALAVELRPAAERLSFPLGYWNALGYLMASTLPALAALAVSGRARLSRAALAGSVPVVLVLFLTSSRGALLAAAAALGAVLWLSHDRGQLLRLGLAALPAWVLVILAAATTRSELVVGEGPSVAGLILVVALLAAGGLAYLTAARLRSVGRDAPKARGRARVALVTGAIVAALAAAAIGVSPFVGEFRTDGADDEATADALVSGSGRTDFWGTAIEAFADEPVRGLGAGGYENYWNANGGLALSARNAHSTPLETMAELGLVGISLLAGFIGLVGWAAVRRARTATAQERPALASLVGVLLAGGVAIAIDWTWEVSAALIPAVLAAGMICGPCLHGGPPARGAGRTHSLSTPGSARVGPARALLGTTALLSLWAGAVLALSGVQLERAGERLARGDLQGAAEAARSAADIQPWSSEPSLLLAEIEEAGGNYEAARRRAEEAIRMAPDDYRSWGLLSQIRLRLGDTGPAFAYLDRGLELAPFSGPRRNR